MSRGLTKAGSTRAWRITRALVLQRDGYQCQIRGPHCTGTATCVDHIQPRQSHGGDDPANLRSACTPCNAGRKANPPRIGAGRVMTAEGRGMGDRERW